MELLEGCTRDYAWGSPDAIPALLGRPASGGPVAELWLGAHPSGPALVGVAQRPLDEVIRADPVAALGSEWARRGAELPFLFKVIAAAEPLSLQAHPSAAQAERGHAREEAAGVPVDSPERSFRDRRHKPELICALSRFRALHGFRPPAASVELLDSMPTPALNPLRAILGRGRAPDALREALASLLSLDPAAATGLVAAVVEACTGPGPREWAAERAIVADLGRRHPRDPAVVAAALLNAVVLRPTQALFLGAGNLHAYLDGTGVEVMANSDNVVRGGLTTKPVDPAALLEIVDTRPVEPEILDPPLIDGEARYPVPVTDFVLTRIEVAGAHTLGPGPAVVVCTEGCVEAADQVLDRGVAVWIPASDPPVELRGHAVLFRASAGAAVPA